MSDTTASTIPSTPGETDRNVAYYCRHLTTKGVQCRQASLNGRNFCYAHRNRNLAFGHGSVKVPLLEDSASIQLMLTKILHAILNDHLNGVLASKAVYCCQVAASTLPRPVAYRPRLGEKLPAEPLAAMEIYMDPQENLMGPLEEYPLPDSPAAEAEPESARAKARAEWDQCVMHNRWCSGPAATHKCDDCKRAAGHLPSEPAMDEPTQEPSAVSPAPDPGATLPADEPSTDESASNEYSPVSSSQSCELAELTAAADSVPCSNPCPQCTGHCSLISDPCAPGSCLLSPVSCSGARCPVPRPNVVELVKQPNNMIPNDKKLVPQGGTPHFQNKSTQKPRSTSSQPLPLLSLEERSTRYYASATELALSEFAPGDRVERASAESEIPAYPSLAAHLYPVTCTLYPASISSPPQQTPSTDRLSCRAESAPARSIQGERRERASRENLRHRDGRREQSSSSSRRGRSK